eukprot:SAG31_NODE_787_length_12094_cov_27.048270_2_plen_320_part_00
MAAGLPCAKAPSYPCELTAGDGHCCTDRPAPLLSPGCMARGLPAVVSSPEDALAAVKVDGACILQWNFQHTESSVGEVRAAAATIGRKIFGEQLALQKAPIGVNDQSRIRKPRGADGTREYGDLLPDYVVLMPDRLPAAGGHFYLVDGYGLLAGLKPTDYGAAFDVPMVPADPSAVGRGEPAVGDGSNEWIPPRRAGWKSPIAKRVAGSGRIMLRPPVEGNATNRPNRDQPDPSLAATAPHLMQAGQKMIEAWRRAVTEAGKSFVFSLRQQCVSNKLSCPMNRPLGNTLRASTRPSINSRQLQDGLRRGATLWFCTRDD